MPHLPTISDTETEERLKKKLGVLRLEHEAEEKKQEAQSRGLDFVSLTGKPIPVPVLSLIPEEEAHSIQTVCYYKDNSIIKLASVDPSDSRVQKVSSDFFERYNIPVKVAMTSKESLTDALKQYQYVHSSAPEGTIALNPSDIESFTEQLEDYRELEQQIKGVPLSKSLNLILAAAIKINASDIHLQPQAEGVQVRFRIDGVLHDIFALNKEQFIQIKKRVKLVAKLKINIENKPQDGSCSITVKGEKIDLRISTLPTNYGESVVVRILNPQAVLLDFEALGVRGQALSLLEAERAKPNGMILSCGPTGSGKTTTLYAMLKKLNTQERQIVTLEDPIEYKLEGILQTQVSEKNISFATGLKAVLRQDPDIVMVGEIRDLETAETAINAALTGHLVLSTLHTNNAAGAIPRFLAMGVKPYLLGPALNIVIGQRLVRRLCPHCKKTTKLKTSIYEKVKAELSRLPEAELSKIDFNRLAFYTAPGCFKCHGLGLKGRVGIFEMLKTDEYIIAEIQKGWLTEYKVLELAQKQGMLTMVQDGLLKAMDGITTVEEVYRVTA